MKTVVVAGDLILDSNLAHHAAPPTYHKQAPRQAVSTVRKGGAWYLRDLVDMACDGLSSVTAYGPTQETDYADMTARVTKAHQVWKLNDDVQGSKGNVWRIDEFLGCDPAPPDAEPLMCPDSPSAPDVLVLDDLCIAFRDQPARWPASLVSGDPKRIVLKTSSTPDGSRLWTALLSRFADRLTVVLHAKALRARGARIEQALSWDKTIEDTIAEFRTGRSSHDLAKCRRVIVHFGASGVAAFTRLPLIFDADQPRDALLDDARFERFVYDPEETEGSWEGRRPGTTFGSCSILTASMARHELEPGSHPLFIALARGLAAVRCNHHMGGGSDETELCTDAAHEPMRATLHGENEAIGPFRSAFPRELCDDGPLGRSLSPDDSDLLLDSTGYGLDYVASIAVKVVSDGINSALPSAPKARYGAFVTVDREEIERINALRNLILTYTNNKKDRRPLSVAVFGPPGSGKSFAIKQLAKGLSGIDPDILTFNLSQFRADEEQDELHAAFRRVRDASVQGQIPLVFWDEFDSDGLKWLTYFLAPMQDSEFRVGSREHPFGKAIFIFAGGTSETFEAFVENGWRDERAFRNVKGPDFVSRLRGFVNVKGPNPTGETPEADPAHLIRRAVILRATLERACGQIIDPDTNKARISPGVIWAFLRISRFLHGARSLESVVTMSSLLREKSYTPAALPGEDLLRLHVDDANEFLRLIGEGDMGVQVVERLLEVLAAACHEGWADEKRAQGWTHGPVRDDASKKHPLLVPYRELDEKGKEGNRSTARLNYAKLLNAGYHLALDVGGQEAVELSDDEHHRLSINEHDIWLREHLLRGFEWAEQTNEMLRLHRSLCPFDALCEGDARLDKTIVESMLAALKKHGYRLVRSPENARS